MREPRIRRILRIPAAPGGAIRESLNGQGSTELLPPIIGPVTDPGIRGAKQVTIDFYGREYKVMSSAILYKQMMAASLGRVYFFSPNVRLEPLETASTGRHLVEFVQVDVEEAGATYEDAMRRAEARGAHVSDFAKTPLGAELAAGGRTLNGAAPPFPRLTYDEALDLLETHGREVSYGVEIPWDHEEFLSALFREPFFIKDYPRGSRGFLDRQDPDPPGGTPPLWGLGDGGGAPRPVRLGAPGGLGGPPLSEGRGSRVPVGGPFDERAPREAVHEGRVRPVRRGRGPHLPRVISRGRDHPEGEAREGRLVSFFRPRRVRPGAPRGRHLAEAGDAVQHPRPARPPAPPLHPEAAREDDGASARALVRGRVPRGGRRRVSGPAPH